MDILVIGGTGFIGLPVVQTLSQRGHRVTVLCRNPVAAEAILPPGVATLAGDVQTLTTPDWQHLLAPFQGVVFAAGVDERVRPIGDARDFFFTANVAPCERLFTAARHTGITHAVLINSMFAWLARQHPGMHLAERHPYIDSRVMQSSTATQLAHGAFVMNVLEVPYVFGASQRALPLWSTLVNYVRGAVPLLVCRGGANMMAVSALADAVAGAMTTTASHTLPVGDTNYTWQALFEQLCICTGRLDRRVTVIPEKLFREVSRTGGIMKELLGIESGLDTAWLDELLQTEMFFDPAESQQLFGYSGGHVETAMQETVDSTPENPYLRNWRKTLNLFSPDFYR